MRKCTILPTFVVAFLLLWPASARSAEYVGSGNDDVFVGTSARDHVSLHRGADLARTRGGADLVDGGGGSDVLTTGDGRDDVRPGSGSDVVRLGAGSDEVTVYADHSVDVIDCGAGYDTVVIVNEQDVLDQFTSCEELLLLTLSP